MGMGCSLCMRWSTVYYCSIEYWFRCMDLDGDGVISMYEMEYFYEEMVQRMESLGIETLPFEDCLCQVSVVEFSCK